jgi:predicted dehydrogenase
VSARKPIRFGVIGAGLMGREFAAAAARWCQLDAGPNPPDHEPVIVGVCDLHPPARAWFERNCPVRHSTDDYTALLHADDIDALYIAVPHHLHEKVYTDAIQSGKGLLGEKPFGIDKTANAAITEAIHAHPQTFVRCSSEIPFFPGAQRIVDMVRQDVFGTILDVEACFWHSSDLNPDKPINWKRQVRYCGEYGVLGDLGMHPLHLPLRFGWLPTDIRGVLSKVVTTRPEAKGSDQRVPCETWDNAAMLTRVKREGHDFPMTVSVKRIAPGHQNTWSLRIAGTRQSAFFSTENPKVLRTLPYPANGGPQAWNVEDVPHDPRYASITGGIFEFGLCDAIQQMWAAFCDELVHGIDGMQQTRGRPFTCVTPEEASQHHVILDAALRSHLQDAVIKTGW